MYIELPSHSLLQGGPFFFADFCEIEKKKMLTKSFQKVFKKVFKNVERTETLKKKFII